MRRLYFILLAALSLVACDKGDDTSTITGYDRDQLNQTLYANQTGSGSGFTFTAAQSWTTQVVDATRAAATWVTIDPPHGEAGTFTLNITLMPNLTGKDRTATIRIVCGDTTITITVEQKGVTEEGDEPQPEVPVSHFITSDGRITGGEIFGQMIWKTSSLTWHISRMDEAEDDGSSDIIVSPSPYLYENNTFRMTLPTPPANCQGGMFPGVSVTPSDARFSSCEIEGVELTDIPWNEYNIYGRKVTKGQGFVQFIYASKAATVNGTFTNPDAVNTTAKFANCQFRKGWNEVILVASADNNSITEGSWEVVMNKTTNAYKWVSTNYMQIGIINRIEQESTITHNPGTAGQYVSGGGATTFFGYDNMTRVSQLKDESGKSMLSIQYNPNNVVFTPTEMPETSETYPLNNAGYISSAVLPNGTGRVEYKYDNEGNMTEAVVTDNISIGGITKKFKEIIDVERSSLWYQRYIDFNGNNVFDDSERVAFESTSYSYNHSMDTDIYPRPNIDYILFYMIPSAANGVTIASPRHITGLMGTRYAKWAWPSVVTTRRESRPYDKNGLLSEEFDMIIQSETRFEYGGYTLGAVTTVNIMGFTVQIDPQTQEVIHTLTSFENKLKLFYKNKWQ